MPVLWKADPNLQAGGYFYDSDTGQPLPPATDASGQPRPILDKQGNPVIWDGSKYITAAQQKQAQGKSATDTLVSAYEAIHGKRVSEPSLADEYITNPNKALPSDPDKILNSNPTRHYTFADGATLDVDSQGQVVKQTQTPRPTIPDPKTIGSSEVGYWEKQPDGSWKQVLSATESKNTQLVNGVVYRTDPANPTGPMIAVTPGAEIAQAKAQADVTKALTDIGYTQAQAAALALESPARVQQALAAAGASQAQTQKALQDLQIAQAKLGPELAQIGAQTAEAQARTGQIQSAVEIAQAKAPAEIEASQASAAASRAAAGASEAQTARTKQQIAQANVPTVENIAATSPYIYQKDPNTGKLTPSINLGYQPKTQAEVAARVAQLQQFAQEQKQNLLAQRANGTLTDEQVAQQFDQFWSQNIESQKQALDVAQRSALMEEQKAREEQNRANYATAQTAGNQAAQLVNAQLPYMAGPGFGQMMNQIAQGWSQAKVPSNLDLASGLTFQLPDVTALSQQITNQALAHMSPTAANNMNMASGANTPNFGPQMNQMTNQPMDINAQLNKTNYQPGSTTITVGPNGGTTIQQNNAGGGGQTAGMLPLPGVAAPNQVAGQNYGSDIAYTGGIPPWRYGLT